jgi:uncharacterized protein with beta-barrel porin domain
MQQSNRNAAPTSTVRFRAVGVFLTISAVMLAGQSAWAACTPQAAGQPSLSANCTGSTLNQGGGAPGTNADVNGYGTGAEDGTVTVVSGASVTGTPAGSRGIYLGRGTVINSAGATITGDRAGIGTGGTDPLAVTNSGSITSAGFGVEGLGQLTVTNNAGGVITGAAFGVAGDNSLNLANYGTITGTNSVSTGATAFTTATVTNYASGRIAGGVFGLSVNQAATVVNFGSIAGTNSLSGPGNAGTGMKIGASSTVVNNAGASITGASAGILTLGAGASIYNAGTISGQVNGISATSGGGFPLGGGLSIFNAGTIAGEFGPAIQFAGTGNTLTLAPGSGISGAAIGTGNDTFQLGGSGTATFDVSQLAATAQYRGFSTMNKIDDSRWTLTGKSTFTGPINVNGGLLAVNGDVSSATAVVVNAGGTLGGTGTLPATFVNGGTLAPGNSIGALTVAGKLSFTAASTYLIEVSPSGADRTNVIGPASLGGATVHAAFGPGSYISKQYTILSASDGVSGTFGAFDTNLSPNLSAGLSYDADDVYLNLVLHFAIPGGLNANQQKVGNALTNFFDTNGSIPVVFGTLTPAGLTQASGETAVGSQQATFNAMNEFMGVLTDPFIAGRGETVTSSGASFFATDEAGHRLPGPERDAYAAMSTKAPVAQVYDPRWSVWGAGFGGTQNTDGNASLGSNNTASSLAAVAGGADYHFSPNTVAGFALAGGGTSFSVDNGGTGRSDLFQAGAFVRHQMGAAYILGAAAYGLQDITTDRTVTIAGADRLHADFRANAYSGRLEGGYRVVTPWLGGVGITPYAAGQFTTFDLPAYAESVLSGTPAFALTYAAKSVTDSRSELGVRGDKSFAMSNALLTLRGRLAWAHDFNSDRSIAATFQSLPGASFVVNGAAQPHDSALTTASAEVKWMNGWSAAATFEGEFADTVRSYAGKGVVRYSW